MTNCKNNSETIAVAMSGGVDSSTVAAMLHGDGHNVIGLTMQLWNHRRLPGLYGDGPVHHRCCSIDDVYDARRVAEQFGFPFYVVNFERQFEAAVVRPFVNEYLEGRTPIPCSLCNSFLKFDSLLLTARQIGAERLATGHYARIQLNQQSGRYELLRARDLGKDQSYFLFGLTQEQMAWTAFPLGELTKSEVRQIARRLSVLVADKPESQEICFVPTGDYAQFIESYLKDQNHQAPPDSGEMVTEGGGLVGRHQGLHRYTVGQRRGLGVATGAPLYVLQIDRNENRLVVGAEQELYKSECEVGDVNWISVATLDQPARAEVKIRLRHEAAPATLEPVDANSVRVRFEAPQRAITPGQSAVFYSGNNVLGGGWIRQ
jgi:tRNA-specific 2-thiouridylase